MREKAVITIAVVVWLTLCMSALPTDAGENVKACLRDGRQTSCTRGRKMAVVTGSQGRADKAVEHTGLYTGMFDVYNPDNIRSLWPKLKGYHLLIVGTHSISNVRKTALSFAAHKADLLAWVKAGGCLVGMYNWKGAKEPGGIKPRTHWIPDEFGIQLPASERRRYDDTVVKDEETTRPFTLLGKNPEGYWGTYRVDENWTVLARNSKGRGTWVRRRLGKGAVEFSYGFDACMARSHSWSGSKPEDRLYFYSAQALLNILRYHTEAAHPLGLRAELPRLRVPLAFVSDDGAPALIDRYDYLRQPRRFLRWFKHRKPGEKVVHYPSRFVHEFADWCIANGVKGKFSIVPNPSGMGFLDKKVEGVSEAERIGFIAAMKKLQANFDITPEILTHTLAMDLKTGDLLPISEPLWAGKQDVETLAAYMSKGFETLKNCGLSPHGLTQPNIYDGDIKVYAEAILKASRKTVGRDLSFFFLNLDYHSKRVLPIIQYLDRRKARAVVNVVCGFSYPCWEMKDGRGNVRRAADYFISRDGKSGRMVDLFKTDSYLVFLIHWQPLWGNGTEKGFKTLKEVVRRAKTTFGDCVVWMKFSELARYHVATRTYDVKVKQDRGKTTIAFTCPFDCSNFTVSLDVDARPKFVKLVGAKKPFTKVASRKSLKEGTWLREEGRIYLCFPLKAKAKTEIEVSIR